MAGIESGVVAIIDDDIAVRESLKILLEMSAFTVVGYPSATEFLEDRFARPTCLIVDQHMPRMTGLELAAQMRAKSACIPILLITAMSSPEIIARAAQLGIEKVLDKPPSANDLLGFVGEYCRSREQAGFGAASEAAGRK